MNKRHFMEGSGSKKGALSEALKRQVADLVLKGKVKPPKSKEQGDLEVMSKRQSSMKDSLRKDFGLKAARKKASGGMRRSMY